MHIGSVDVLDPVQTILGIVGAGDVHAVVAVQDGQGAAHALRLADFHGRVVAQVGVLQHGLAIGVGAHHKDIEAVILAVGTPVVLGALQRRVHLIQPGANQGGILGVGGHHAAAAIEAGGVGTVAGGQVADVSLQHGQRSPGSGAVDDLVHGQANDVRHVPAEADAVAAGLALSHVGAPLLGEGLGIEQALGVQLVQPLHALAVALGGSGADDLALVGDDDVTAVIGIAVALAEAVGQHAAVLIAGAHDAGQGDDVAFDVELSLQLVSVVTERQQHLLELVNGGGHLQAQEVQPGHVDEGHVADGLDGGLLIAQLLDPGQRPDVAVLVGAHGAILGSLLEHLAQVGHILVDVILHVDDDALLGVLQQVGITEAGGEHELGEGLDVGHLQGDLVAPLVALDGLPGHMDVGLLLQTLEDGAVVGLRLGARGVVDQAADLSGLCQGELQGSRIHLQAGLAAGRSGAAAAAGQQHHRHGQGQNDSKNFAHVAHTFSPLSL